MGDVIDPKFPSWERRFTEQNAEDDDATGDLVIMLAKKVMAILGEEAYPLPTQLAAFLLVLRAVIGVYKYHMGEAAKVELLEQAKRLADRYEVRGTHGDTYHEF